MKVSREKRWFGPGLLASAYLVALAVLLAPGQGLRCEVVDRIVAVVNDSVITLSELNAAAAVAMERPGAGRGADPVETKSRILDSLIEQKLVKQASDKAGIDVSRQEIDNAVEDIKRQNGLTHDELIAAISQSGLTYDEYRAQIKEQIRQVKFITKEFRSKIAITPEDVEDYYKQNADEFRGSSSYRLRIIFISGADMGLMALRLKAVLEALDAGRGFEEVAAEYSDGPGASSGGDIGYLNADEMDPSILKAAKGLDTGGVSPPIKTRTGTYIIKLVDRKGGDTRPFEEVREQIYDRLFKTEMDERYRSWLEKMKKVAHIEVRM